MESISQKFRNFMENKEDYLLLDTETTGLGPTHEIIELGIIDLDGNEVYHSLFKPKRSIDPGAARVHGITDGDLVGAPAFSQEYDRIHSLLNGKTILIYNASFDSRMLNQTARIHGLPNVIKNHETNCIMLDYAVHNGEYNPQRRSYKWVKLEQACRNEGVQGIQDHRATGDCLLTLEVIKKVAASDAAVS